MDLDNININTEDINLFIKSYKNRGSINFLDTSILDNFNITLDVLLLLKKKYNNNEISLEKYLYLISLIELYLLKKNNYIEEDEIFVFLSNEILLVEIELEKQI